MWSTQTALRTLLVQTKDAKIHALDFVALTQTAESGTIFQFVLATKDTKETLLADVTELQQPLQDLRSLTPATPLRVASMLSAMTGTGRPPASACQASRETPMLSASQSAPSTRSVPQTWLA